MNKEEIPAWACLCFRPGTLEATTRHDPPSAECPHTLNLEGEPSVTLNNWMTQVPEVRNLAVAVPTEDVLILILDLPTLDAGEISDMVELQAEEISPFPPERTHVAWEVLRELGQGASRVMIVLMAEQKLQRIHDLLLPTVGLPVRLDVEVMGWLEMMLVNGYLSTGDVWVLLLTGREATLVAWHGNTPVMIRSLGDQEELSGEVVQEEIAQAQISVETAFPRARMEALQIWHFGEAPEWAAGSGVPWRTTVHSLEQFPPATHGVLVRSQLGYLLDLTPERWRTEVSARAARKKLIRVGGAVAACWLLLLGGLMGWGWTQSRRVEALEAENQANAPRIEEIRELTNQVRSLSQFTDRSRSALEALKILSESAPGIGALQVEEFRYRKQGRHVFNGTMGRNVQPFNRFLDALTGSDQLSVEDYDLQQTRSGYEFRLEMDWEWGGGM